MTMFTILQYSFIQNAFLAGTCVAVVAAVAGYFMVARGLTFAGHALPNIGFAGAAGAVLLGVDPVIGLYVFTIGAAIGIGLLGKEVNERDTSIGIIMTFALGLGILFLSLYFGYAERVYSILFGQIVGISQADVLLTGVSSLLTLAIFLVLFRPLLFSS
ncbi:MAG TPA: ABC transporter permease, partial [Ktedonobacter sp.]|nr:ABC transporter permease [Ktedonobacter sp.]